MMKLDRRSLFMAAAGTAAGSGGAFAAQDNPSGFGRYELVEFDQ